MDVVIARIAPEHIEGFYKVVDFVARERKYLAFLEAPPLASTSQFVMNNISRGYPQFVAIADDKVVGWCDIIPKDRPVHVHGGVLGMGLLPPFRGRGNGTALVNATLNEAWRQSLVRVELTVHADNARAIALYKKVGFETEGILRDAVRIDGRYKDLILMAILNHPPAVPNVLAGPIPQ
jgi:RimJ/RimL family protein N-acetyltransferase